MAPKELEKVLYFAASIVTWVDDEARAKDLDKLEKEVNKVLDSYAAEREERVLELQRVAGAPRAVPARPARQAGFSEEDHLWADSLEVNIKKISDEERDKLIKELRKSLEADIADTEAYIEDAAERMRQRVGAVQDDGAQADRARRDDVPRAQGALRLALRLRRVLPRRDGRRGGPRPARGRSTSRPRRDELEDQVRTAKGQKRRARSSA